MNNEAGEASTTAIPELAWAAAVEVIARTEQVVLVCHVRPDADALGSALATALALRALGKRVQVSYGDDPFELPGSLAFLPALDLVVPPEQVPDAPELVVSLDVASVDRFGVLAPKVTAADTLVVLDHHASNPGFGTHRLIDPASPATVVLVEELLRRLGVELTPEIASCLYAGLATDTGSFRHPSTTPATHEFAARLLAVGIRHDEICRQLWDTVRFGYLAVLGRALERARLAPGAAGGHGLVWTVVPRADRAEHGLRLEEVEGVIDLVRKAAEAEVAVVLKEDDHGCYQLSLRSKGAVDVGAVCVALGGGGHRFAAGYTAGTGTPEQVVAELARAFAEVAR